MSKCIKHLADGTTCAKDAVAGSNYCTEHTPQEHSHNGTVVYGAKDDSKVVYGDAPGKVTLT